MFLNVHAGWLQLSTSAASWHYQENCASASASIFLVDMSAGALEDPMATHTNPVAATPQVQKLDPHNVLMMLCHLYVYSP